MLTGTIVNALAILAGSAAGMLLTWLAGRFSGVLPTSSVKLGERLQTIIMQGVALCVLYLGISGSLDGQNTLIAILSMVLGAILGELLDLDKRMRSLGDWVQKKTERQNAVRKAVTYILLTLWALIVLFPFYWMVLTSVNLLKKTPMIQVVHRKTVNSALYQKEKWLKNLKQNSLNLKLEKFLNL